MATMPWTGSKGAVTLGTATEAGIQFGQKVKGGEAARIHVRRIRQVLGHAGSATFEDRATGQPLGPGRQRCERHGKEDEWTEMHVTFKVEKPFPQGWFAYISG